MAKKEYLSYYSFVMGHYSKKFAKTNIYTPKESFKWGYDIVMIRQDPKKVPQGFIIKSGCRWFTPAKAMSHWRGGIDFQNYKSVKEALTRNNCCDCRACVRNNMIVDPTWMIRQNGMALLIPKLIRKAKQLGWAAKKPRSVKTIANALSPKKTSRKPSRP